MPNLFGECFGWLRLGSIHADITINGRSFRVIKKLGEGGYAIVYLVKDVTSTASYSSTTDVFAVKKVFTNTEESLQLMKSEIRMLQSFKHPNLVELLDAKIFTESTPSSSVIYSAYMLFPAYQHGTLGAEIDRLVAADVKLPTSEVLNIFLQICLGVQYMHDNGYAHRDLKPHNVLIVRPGQQSHDSLVNEAPLPTSNLTGYQALIMDFGSARPVPLKVSGRMQALAAQEDAEANCTGTYRAPELFDVASHCTLDSKVDVWALGCSLYHIMYGVSPFQHALNKGDSLALAVLERNVPFPTSGMIYPDQLHDLAMDCLSVDPSDRPFCKDLVQRIHKLSAEKLLDPQLKQPGSWVVSMEGTAAEKTAR